MNRIEKVFKKLAANGEKGFVPYIMAGDGGLDVLGERITFLERAGATAIEIGIPFSDPVADGPLIQEAGIRALKANISLRDVITAIRSIRPVITVPIIFMTYLNPILAYGIDQCLEDCRKAGVDGFIIPDLPFEEEELLSEKAEREGIELIRLVTLTSPLERIQEISKRGKGFLYAVTVNGITGTRSEFHSQLGSYLKSIKEVSTIPVLAGFGISTPAQVEAISSLCDGVIVGSKIVQSFEQNELQEIETLIRSVKQVNISG
ncbi:tryptophan synthase subunit alpha [Cytobacillus gottheilii]|uniref:tryptophan synthase subunit alpha n=1 Tax=Cytobacillus gottheilii TaxID=859144 RepID=UPI0009BC0DD2|nr:tryptophan synthase subunit alpha [Cytobacillus gottheilii]